MQTNIDTHITAAKEENQPKCPPTDAQINEMWSLHGVLLIHKRKEALTPVTMWMQLKILC